VYDTQVDFEDHLRSFKEYHTSYEKQLLEDKNLAINAEVASNQNSQQSQVAVNPKKQKRSSSDDKEETDEKHSSKKPKLNEFTEEKAAEAPTQEAFQLPFEEILQPYGVSDAVIKALRAFGFRTIAELLGLNESIVERLGVPMNEVSKNTLLAIVETVRVNIVNNNGRIIYHSS
jgi:hypothetical protein